MEITFSPIFAPPAHHSPEKYFTPFLPLLENVNMLSRINNNAMIGSIPGEVCDLTNEEFLENLWADCEEVDYSLCTCLPQ